LQAIDAFHVGLNIGLRQNFHKLLSFARSVLSFYRPCPERQKYATVIIALQRRYCDNSVLATIGKTCKKIFGRVILALQYRYCDNSVLATIGKTCKKVFGSVIFASQYRYCDNSVLATIGKTCKQKSSEVLYLPCNIVTNIVKIK